MIGPVASGAMMPTRPRQGASEPKRRNRTVGLGEALGGALDPALKRRGFASRDIVKNWQAMAPRPYDRVAMPDTLSWPRGERRAPGATLYLRCVPGHGLALQHEAPRIAAAINRYFGYVLVNEVRLSPMPFTPGSAAVTEAPSQPDPARRAAVGEAVKGVADDRLRAALDTLGLAIATRRG
jgi:hypothetical protein